MMCAVKWARFGCDVMPSHELTRYRFAVSLSNKISYYLFLPVVMSGKWEDINMRQLQSLKITAIAILAGTAIFSFAACKNSSPPEKARNNMVRTQLELRGIREPLLLDAFRTVPREKFVLPRYREHAYDDVETPIGFGQSLDRPYENAMMLKTLGLAPGDRVLEIGTGVGYFAALMSHIAKEVFTIEIEPAIADTARANLEALDYANIKVKTGDGFMGWPEYAPFDAIIMACSPDRVPDPLAEQLKEGGHILLPLGGTKKFQELVLYTKKDGKLIELRRLGPTEFSPMKGKVMEVGE